MTLYRGFGEFYKKNSLFLKPRLEEASDRRHINFFKFISSDNFSALDGINSQLFFYACSCAIFDMLCSSEPPPGIVTGYSMGMFSAFFAAGVVSFSDGLEMIYSLDALAAESCAGKNFSMLAVSGCTEEELTFQIDRLNTSVTIVNQTYECGFILAGLSGDMKQFIQLAGKKIPLISKLPVNLPYHTKLLYCVKAPWGNFLRQITFNTPRVPVLCSRTQTIISTGESSRNIAVSNIYLPFSWFKTIKKLDKLGVCEFMECGPSLVLSKIGGLINSDYKCYNVKSLP